MKNKFVALILSIFCFMFVAYSAPLSPKAVVSNWITAIVAGDAKTANNYSTEKTHAMNILMAMGAKEDPKAATQLKKIVDVINMSKVEIEGDIAYVYPENATKAEALKLKRENGRWLVDISKE